LIRQIADALPKASRCPASAHRTSAFVGSPDAPLQRRLPPGTLEADFWIRPGASAGSRRCLIGARGTGLSIPRQGPLLLAKAGIRRARRNAYEQRLTGRVQLAAINV
jgi:hypothetical protein